MTHQYAHQMEKIFKKIHPSIPLDADSFDIRPKEALEDGLEYLYADGLIQKEDISEFMETYDFGDENHSSKNQAAKSNTKNCFEEFQIL